MSKSIQIRNLPEELRRELKSRAAQRGKSFADYMLGLLEEIASRPTPEEIRARMAAREPFETSPEISETLRAEPEGR